MIKSSNQTQLKLRKAIRLSHADPDLLGVCLKGGNPTDEVGVRDLDTLGGARGA